MTRKAAPLEKDIQAKILEYLTKRGVFHFKAIVSSKLGIPDIITCINGRFVCFEVKRSENARIHPMQHHIHEQITEAEIGRAHV